MSATYYVAGLLFGGKRVNPLLKLICKRGHIEQRCAASLQQTSDNTQCKVCRRNRWH